MKRVIALLLLLAVVPAVSALPCSIDATLLNQDPYPAVPGDYVKLVFQLEGLENPECGSVTFDLLEDYPISFPEGKSGLRKFDKVSFIRNFESNILVSYDQVRVSENALDGATPIEARITSSTSAEQLVKFDLEIDDTRADFEVHISEYSPSSAALTFEILNIAESDVKALTVEIPSQDAVILEGSNRVIVGDLDSNEYSSADFVARPTNGEVKLLIHYTDAINVRRTVEKMIPFDDAPFTNKLAVEEKSSAGTYIFVLIVAVVVYYFWRRSKKKKRK